MKIEVFGPTNSDGSSHPAWTYEIDPGCERVLVTPPGFRAGQTAPKVWGFLPGDRQVHARLVGYEPAQCWVA